MRIDRDSFNDNFTTYNIPNWNCSTCKKGKIVFDQKNVVINELNESLNYRQNYAWEPNWIRQHFTGTIVCNNPKCKEKYSIAGRLEVEEDFDEEQGHSYVECYYLQYIYPILHVFDIPKLTPAEVQETVISAFKVFWIDKNSCANAIRRVVEAILNDKKVLKTELTSKKKRRILSPHERIEIFETKNKIVANYLMAIKWIGNAGSHDDKISIKDILDSLDILKYSLEMLYTSHEKEIVKMTKKINKNRKPIK